MFSSHAARRSLIPFFASAILFLGCKKNTPAAELSSANKANTPVLQKLSPPTRHDVELLTMNIKLAGDHLESLANAQSNNSTNLTFFKANALKFTTSALRRLNALTPRTFTNHEAMKQSLQRITESLAAGEQLDFSREVEHLRELSK